MFPLVGFVSTLILCVNVSIGLSSTISHKYLSVACLQVDPVNWFVQ